jgi:LysW-gamma-L-lysine carboxypeptidase
MRNEAVDLLREMLKVYSPSGHETEIGSLLVEAMARLGYASHIDSAGNAVGEFGHDEPVILLCGHMDTVSGLIPVKMKGTRLYGRGAVDAKAPLAAMLMAATRLLREGFPCRVIVVGCVDEEGAGKGVNHLIESGPIPDYAIFGEPSGSTNITIAYKGSLHLNVTVATRASHSAAPWLSVNAIEEAFEIWKRIRNLGLGEPLPSKFYSFTSCMTRIEGGSTASTVPHRCSFHVDYRVPPPYDPVAFYDTVRSTVTSCSKRDVSVTMSVEDYCPPFEADKNSVLVRALSLGIRRVTKQQAVLTKKTGTGDMNLYGSTMRIPVATYGPGDSRLDHSAHEHIDVNEYLQGIDVLYEGLKALKMIHDHVHRGVSGGP